jgi:hypothetical protein
MSAGFSFRELQKCADREVAMRRNVFAKRGMTDDRRLEIPKMEAIAAHFRMLADSESPVLVVPHGGTAA